MNLSGSRTRAISSSVALLAALVVDAYPQPSRLIKGPLPEPASIGTYKGHCVSMPSAIRICKLLSDREDIVLVEKDGKRVGSWPASAYLGETADFEVLRGDLDGDGRPELIVSNRDSSSAGMGVNYWTIAILPDVESGGFEPPLTFRVEDYGSFGTFVSAGGKVSILATKWLWTKDSLGKRGRGLYLVGQWWRYKAGQLLPLLSRPGLMRRYLLSFERERLQTIDSPYAPYRWLTRRNVIPMRRELDTTQAKNAQEGIISSVSSLPDKNLTRAMMLVLKPDNQGPIVYVYPSDQGEDEHNLSYIGDGVSGRLYPIHYLPSQSQTWLQGKRATVLTYRETPDSKSYQVLWIGEVVNLMRTQNRSMEKELKRIVNRKSIPAGFSITYDDMHGLWGGVTITIDGVGNVEVRERGQTNPNPKITEARITKKRLRDLIKLVIELQAWEQQTLERKPLPDESRARLTIKSGDQVSVTWEWFDDMEKNRRLIQIKTKMEQLVKK